MSLKEIVDPRIYETYHMDESMSFEVKECDPSLFLTPGRLDLMAKIIYLKLRNKAPEYAKKVYLESIRCMTKDSFLEWNTGKKGKEDFLKAFDQTYESMKNNGYSDTVLPVPVGNNNQILDGAHRIACAFVLHIPVKAVFIPVEAEYDIYDADYFRSCAVDENVLDEMVLEYVRLHDHMCCFNFWPSAKGHDSQAEEILKKHFDIVYRKEITLNETGAFNYLTQIYSEYSWAQEHDNDGYAGVYRKLVPCFPDYSPVRAYIVQVRDYADETAVKEEIRQLYQLEKHSVHATDSQAETIAMASLLLSSNTVDFMNHANVTKYKNTLELLKTAKDYDLEQTVFTGSIVLAMYGIRQAEDLDYLTLDETKVRDSHNDLLPFYGMTLKEAVYDPEQYFMYSGMKFLTLNNVRKFKANRNEGKDRDDLQLIDLVLSSGDKKNYKAVFLRWRRRTVARMQGGILRFAHKTGTYDAMRKVYRTLKGKK